MEKIKILNYKNIKPILEEDVFIAPGAFIIGDVEIKKQANIWFGSIIRGDVAKIYIGENTNIQDGTIIHTSRFGFGKTVIGKNVNVGHAALLHACNIKDNAFIGMRAVVMDNALVEEYGFVAAGALITPNKIIRERELWAGSPARFVRYVTEKEIEFMKDNIGHYVKLAAEYKRAI